MKVELVHSKDKANLDEEVVLEYGGIKKEVELNGSIRMEEGREGIDKTSSPVRSLKEIKDNGGIKIRMELDGKKFKGKEIKELKLNFKNKKEFKEFVRSLKASSESPGSY